MPDSSQGRVTLVLRNSLATSRIVVLEPWSGQYTLNPEETLQIVAAGDVRLPLEVELFESQIIVHSFDSEGATMRIFSNGVEIERSE